VTNLVLVEHVFNVPGIFEELTDAMATANFPVLFGMTFVVAALVALGSLALDVSLAWLDPRIRSA
jgi:peptide/nickel transport system permease protein